MQQTPSCLSYRNRRYVSPKKRITLMRLKCEQVTICTDRKMHQSHTHTQHEEPGDDSDEIFVDNQSCLDLVVSVICSGKGDSIT